MQNQTYTNGGKGKGKHDEGSTRRCYPLLAQLLSAPMARFRAVETKLGHNKVTPHRLALRQD